MDNNQELLSIVHVNEVAFSCNLVLPCPYKERTLSYAVGVKVPTPGIEPEEIFKECCYTHYVFADLNNSESYRNDYSSFFHQRQLSNETARFYLFHYELNDEIELTGATYGQFFDFGYFPSNPRLKGVLIDWKKVLTEIGEGNFKIIKRVSIAGVAVEFSSFVFTLRRYSTALADKTTRMDVVMNGKLQKSGVDFTGTNWKQSLRVRGFFGRREPQYEEDNLIDRTFDKVQISMSQSNEYKFQTNLIPDCITDEILDFMVFGNSINFTDYNLNNHSYKYYNFPVKYSGNEGTTYGSHTRKVRLNLLFSDRFANNLKNNFY